MEALGLWGWAAWFAGIVILVIAIMAIVDAIRRSDLSGGSKALWVILILIVPLIGTIVYMIARPSGGVTYGRGSAT